MAAGKKAEKTTFEERMKRLEEVVTRLEAPDLPLEESVELYREGQQLAKSCRADLAAAKQEIAVLTEDGTLEPLSPDEEREKISVE